jgi:hypothetical protein
VSASAAAANGRYSGGHLGLLRAQKDGWVGRKNGGTDSSEERDCETRERAGAGTQKFRLWGIEDTDTPTAPRWCRGNSQPEGNNAFS